jgi:hypothetical protein
VPGALDLVTKHQALIQDFDSVLFFLRLSYISPLKLQQLVPCDRVRPLQHRPDGFHLGGTLRFSIHPLQIFK